MKKYLQLAGASFGALIAAALSLDARAQPSQMPREQTVGVVSFVSGGIGDGEAHRFEAAFTQYPLVVQLFEHVGSRDDYTSDAKVRITDRRGQPVFEQQASGPFILMRLPAGDYRIAAELHGHAAPERTVHVTDSGHAKATFVFPQEAG